MDATTIRWFGPEPFARMCEPQNRSCTPTAPCAWCEQFFGEDDSGLLMPCLTRDGAIYMPWHQDCFLRTISGSVAHQEQRCSCFGGTEPDEDPGLSKREQAEQAVKLWRKR